MSASCIYGFLLATVILSPDQNVAYVSRLEDPLWSVEPISAPIVKARMIFDYAIGNRSEKFTDHSRGIFKRLFIPLNSTLLLFCMAYNPIEWTKNGEVIINNTVRLGRLDKFCADMAEYMFQENILQFSGVQKEDRDFCTHSQNQGGFLINTQSYPFCGRLEITNVTFETAGQYACITRILDLNITIEEPLHTDFEVIVEGPAIADELSEPRILTPMYDKGYYGCPYISAFGFRVIVPLGMEYKDYFVSTDNVTFQLSDVKSHDGNNLKSRNDIVYRAHYRSNRASLSSGILETYLFPDHARSPKPHTSHISHSIPYIVEYQTTDGSWLTVSGQLTVITDGDMLPPEQYEELTARGDIFRVHLSLGRYYTLVYHGDIISGTFVAHVQSSANCELIDFPAESQHGACGVLDTAIKDEKRTEFSGFRSAEILRKSFRVRLKVMGSCVFRMQEWSVERNQTITKTIHVKAVEKTFSPAPGEESIVFVTSDGGVLDYSEMNITDAITIQCRFPACGWEIIALCKHGTSPDCVRLRRENSTYVSFSTRFSHSSHVQNILLLQLTNLTFALEIRIDKLELRHAGDYRCGEAQSSYNTREEYYGNEQKAFPEVWRHMHYTNFRLSVIMPEAPNFVDGQTTYRQIIMNNGEAILDCPFTGSPAPSITWTKQGVYAKDYEITAFANRSSVTVREIGTYECIVKNVVGENSRKYNVEPETQPLPSPLPVALSVTVAAVLVTFIIAGVTWQRRRAKKALFKELAQLLSEPNGGVQLDDVLPLNDQTDILPYNTNYEIGRDRFQLIKVIGDGEFGQIYRGELLINENQRRYVAVKVPKNSLKPEHHQALISELKIMIYLRPHVNVLAHIGACTNELEQRQQLFVLTEYCEKGSLLSYLQDHILDFESQAPAFGIQSLLDFAYQAANGMEHLAAWKIIHRDLAVRNLLLTHRGVIKIADFGLSRQKETVYAYNKFLFRNVRLPVAWMAPESVTRYEYTHKSDVWSLGIVIYEIFSCGRVPYSSVDISGMEIITWLREGNRLSMPVLATVEMYSLMLDCWSTDPTNRPTFSQCKGRIARHLEDKFPSSYTSLLLLLSDSFSQMDTVRQAPSTALSQEIPIYPSTGQQEESVSIEMEIDFMDSFSGDSCSLSTPANFGYVTSVGTSGVSGEVNQVFDVGEPENGYVTSGVASVFDQELPEQQDALEDTPLLG